MAERPKISIVTPSYNQSKYLEETILSVIGQGYDNLEFIIIDGGSTDGSVEIIKKYEHAIDYWVSEPDEGMYDAINKGFARCTGEIMTWVNSDDLLHAGALDLVADILGRYPAIDWLGGCLCQIDEKSKLVWVEAQHPWNKFRYYMKDYQYIQQEGTFWRRKLWDKAGGFISTEFKLAGDLELWLRFFGFADYYSINVPVGCFRVRSNNQKSLEARHLYNQEAEQAIDNYSIADKDRRTLKSYSFSQLSLFRVVFRLFPGLKKNLNNTIRTFPPSFYFDQKKQKHFLNGDQ